MYVQFIQKHALFVAGMALRCASSTWQIVQSCRKTFLLPRVVLPLEPLPKYGFHPWVVGWVPLQTTLRLDAAQASER